MLVEEGKFYLCRDGRVAGPAARQPHSADWPWHITGFGSYSNGGRFNGVTDDPRDLLCEVTKARRWPFVETPGEFTDRLQNAMDTSVNLLAAVRHVLIENAPTLALGKCFECDADLSVFCPKCNQAPVPNQT